jgi:hypothetical protein
VMRSSFIASARQGMENEIAPYSLEDLKESFT